MGQTIGISKSSLEKCSFEDLSNEIIFEMFEYLDFCDIYDAFSNLNTRFENLLIDPIFPIKLSLSSISKSTAQLYNTKFLIPFAYRIKFLHLSNPFIIEFIFSSICDVFKLNQLKKLVLHNVDPNDLEKLLIQLSSLSCLNSLVINCEKYLSNKNDLYLQIFNLPVLKYCQLSLEENIRSHPLHPTTGEFSPIEYLIINNDVCIYELNSLLSYVPYLRHLSIEYLSKFSIRRVEFYSTSLNHLTHVSLHIRNITFDELKLLFQNHFHQVEVLYISEKDNTAILDVYKWKEFLLISMPHIRLFRRRYYLLNKINIQRTCPYNEEMNMNYVHHLAIQDEGQLINSKIYFPNVTKLQLLPDRTKYKSSFLNILNRILCLQRITELIIDDDSCTYTKMIELLNSMPNLHTLIFTCISISETDLVLINVNRTFHMVSKTNKIKNVSINKPPTFDLLKFIFKLCPRMQYLTFAKSEYDVTPLLQILLSDQNLNISHLSSLSIADASQSQMQKVTSLMDSENLLNHYSITHTKGHRAKIHLWW